MTRSLSAKLGHALIAHAMSDKYPTRALEYVLAWLTFVWSVRVVLPGNVMTGPAFRYFLELAPEWCWGALGFLISGLRIVALVRNGGWTPGPLNRAIGAGFGFNFWLALVVLYTMAIWDGAPDFPMRFDFAVLAIAELFCFARCVQEHDLSKAGASGSTVPDNGA